MLGIRPEQFSLAEKPGDDTVTGVIENEEFLGNYSILYVNVDGDTLICRVNEQKVGVGKQVSIRFGMEHIYFFDKETENLVLHAEVGGDDE